MTLRHESHNINARIEPYFKEAEEERLEEAVKGMTPDEREIYLNRVANLYLAELKKIIDLREEYWRER